MTREHPRTHANLDLGPGGPSPPALRRLPENAFDSVLIHSEVSYDAVYENAVQAYRLTRPGGTILFAGYGSMPEATAAVEGFRFEYGALPVQEEGDGLVGIRVPEIKDPTVTFGAALRERWKELPAARQERMFVADLARRTDAELMELWRRSRDETSGYDVRGWYQQAYKQKFAGKTVLDFGSGFSVDGMFFAQHGAKVTFADIVPENLALLQRISSMLGLDTTTYYIEDFFRYDFKSKFDVVMCMGSIINAPLPFTRRQIDALRPFIVEGGTVVIFGYPKERFETSRVRNGREFGVYTDGERTPWCEWLDRARVQALFGAGFDVVYERNFGTSGIEFNWFELTYSRPSP